MSIEEAQKRSFYDLVYAGEVVEALVKARFPKAVIKDASDFVHTERFEVTIPEVSDDDFYPFAVKEGFARCCFGFEMNIQSLAFPESKERPGAKEAIKAKLDRWIELAGKEGVDDKNTCNAT